MLANLLTVGRLIERSNSKLGLIAVGIFYTPSSKLSLHRRSMAEAADKPGRVKPNYFVSIQITNTEIHKKIGEIQEYVLLQEPRLKSTVIALPTLHITLMVMNLPRDNLPIDSIQKAMNTCIEEAKNQTLLPLTLNIEGMGNFRSGVVFAKISPGSALDKLQTLAGIVEKSFSDCGLKSSDNLSFNPHLTVFKLSRDFKLRRKGGIKKIDPTLYEHYSTVTMGEQEVTTLQLCSMNDEKDEKGYYPVLHQVSLNI